MSVSATTHNATLEINRLNDEIARLRAALEGIAKATPEWRKLYAGMAAREALGIDEQEPMLCEDCGKNYADSPSKLCPGCEAYQEHRS